MSSTRCPNTSRGWFFKDIPAEWDSIPLKYACVLTSEYGANIPADRYVSEGVRFLRTSDINDNGELASSSVFISEADAAEYHLAERDLLISRSGTVGRSFLYSKSHGPCAYAGYLIRYRLKQSFAPKYIFYLTKSAGFQKWIGTVAIEATIGNVNGEKYANFSFPSPSFQTQLLIANYLDRETARIDRLIAEKERMLALLDEKRAALISRVVTRGLNPDAPLKDSGHEWLGMIPAHWNTPQLKRTWASSDYGLSESIRDEGDIAVLRMSCIIDGRIDISKSGMITEVDESLLLRRNDLVFNRTNSLDQIAKVGLVDFDPEEPLTFASYLVRLRINRLALPEYLNALLNSTQFLLFARKNAIPAIGQANLSPSRYGEIHIPLPPIAEQEEIVSFLGNDAKRSAPARENIAKSIQLLNERRSALITAAVTGQIPVEEMSQ